LGNQHVKLRQKCASGTGAWKNLAKITRFYGVALQISQTQKKAKTSEWCGSYPVSV